MPVPVPTPNVPNALAALSALALAALTPAAARARLYDRAPPRIEVGLEVAFPIFDASDTFADLTPGVLFGIAAGVHVAPDLRVGAVLRAAISDPEAEHYEVLADLTWSWVDEPRLPDPPTIRAALSFELGWHLSELVGSDFVVTEQGFTASLGGELGLVVFEGVSLSLLLALVSGTASNESVEDWAPKLRLGVSLATVF